MTVYTAPRATAERLIEKFGATITLTRTAAGSYDPSTATTGTATVTQYTGKAFRETYKASEVDGTLIQQNDVRFLLSPFQADGTDIPQPQPSTDTILFAGDTYNVIDVDPFNFSGEQVAFYVQARK